MFTGIVQAVGTVGSLEQRGQGARLSIRAADGLRRLRRGDSIAVNGCCLTIVEKRTGAFAADLTRETLDCTALGDLARGSRVNLEAPLRAGDALSGHLLQGHVEATGKLIELVRVDGESARRPAAEAAGWWLRIEIPGELARYVVRKGSIAIDGISLTVAELHSARERTRIGIAIIPYTHRHTHLAHLRPGARVNIETDPMARHIEQLLEPMLEARLSAIRPGRPYEPSLDELRRQGF